MRATCRPRARHGLPERGRPGDRRGRSHPRQPLPGTREAWPQRVGWLTHLKRVSQHPALGVLGRPSLHIRTRRSLDGLLESRWRRLAGSVNAPAKDRREPVRHFRFVVGFVLRIGTGHRSTTRHPWCG